MTMLQIITQFKGELENALIQVQGHRKNIEDNLRIAREREIAISAQIALIQEIEIKLVENKEQSVPTVTLPVPPSEMKVS